MYPEEWYQEYAKSRYLREVTDELLDWRLDSSVESFGFPPTLPGMLFRYRIEQKDLTAAIDIACDA